MYKCCKLERVGKWKKVIDNSKYEKEEEEQLVYVSKRGIHDDTYIFMHIINAAFQLNAEENQNILVLKLVVLCTLRDHV